MASKTTNYGLNKHSPQDFYNVEARNKNWDKIDEALAAVDPTKITAKAAPADGDGVMIADSADGGKAKRLLWLNVKAALGKLFVPLARKINGKALTKDVTLTAADIKMPNSEEDVGAAMAKRAVGVDIIGNERDLNDVVISGMYRVESPKNVCYDYGQLLVVQGYGDTIAQVSFAYNESKCSVRCARGLYGTNPAIWTPWTEIAMHTAPEVHNFPLADGYTDLGCKYFRTQENVVSFAGEVMRTSGFRADETFAVLPEGFRPDHAIVVPALLYPSYTPTTIIIKSNGEICETITASDKSLYMQATFVAG